MAQKLKQEPRPAEHRRSESITDCDQEEDLPTSPWSLDIIKEIFSYLPPKSLFRFKSVSKSFRDFTKEADFISKYSINSNRRSPSVTGLFYETTTFSLNKNIEFLSTNPDVDLPGLGFLKQRSDKQRSEVHGFELIDSCNGLLLCSTTTNAYVKTVYVCNPLTRQKVVIPHPQRPSNLIYYALTSNLTGLGFFQFRVVCLHRRKDTNSGTELLIYSSETETWGTETERLPELRYDDIDTGTKVFFNGRLFWDCFDIDKILVCHLKTSSPGGGHYFELIEAPASPRGRSLFICDQELICYFHKYKNFAWCLRSDDKNKKLYFEILESCLYFKNLKQDLSRLCKEEKMGLQSWFLVERYTIVAFDHTSDTIFFLFRGSVFSYQVKMRTFDIVLREHYPTRRRDELRNGAGGYVVNYTHCLGRIQEGTSRVEMVKEFESGKKANEDDLVDWTSLMEKNANMVKQRGRRR